MPGLAAMEPDGEFVRTINRHQTGQPSAAQARYYAVMSNFEARAALEQGATPELPPKLLMRIADWGADELYGEPNDLVVHVRSMTHIDPAEGVFVKERLDYGTNPSVYPTSYFTREDTAARFIKWLGLAGVAPAGGKRGAAKRKPATAKRGEGGARRSTSVAARTRRRSRLFRASLTVMECQPPRIMKALAMTVSLTPDPSPSGRGELRESLARLSR